MFRVGATEREAQQKVFAQDDRARSRAPSKRDFRSEREGGGADDVTETMEKPAGERTAAIAAWVGAGDFVEAMTRRPETRFAVALHDGREDSMRRSHRATQPPHFKPEIVTVVV